MAWFTLEAQTDTCTLWTKERFGEIRYANHPALFILFGLFTPVDIVDSVLKGVPHFLALGSAYFLSGLLCFAGLINRCDHTKRALP
jgi:hypothetical protein